MPPATPTYRLYRACDLLGDPAAAATGLALTDRFHANWVTLPATPGDRDALIAVMRAVAQPVRHPSLRVAGENPYTVTVRGRWLLQFVEARDPHLVVWTDMTAL